MCWKAIKEQPSNKMLWKVLKTLNCTVLEMQTRLRFRMTFMEIPKHDFNMFDFVIICWMKTSG